MFIWGTAVSNLQFIGYSIALGGLVYYKLGGEQLKSILAAEHRSWSIYSTRHPWARKVLVFSTFVGVMFLVAYKVELKFDVHHSLSDRDFDTWVGSFVDPYHFR